MDLTISTDQGDIFAFLQTPETHGLSARTTRIDTHGAAVFLAGDDVYKVKRAVYFPYMDFSTLNKRKSACEAEIAVNRRNAPDLYLGIVAITRDSAGFHLGGPGEVAEWAVHLRRFDERATLDRLIENGPLGPDLINQVARTIVEAHQHAPHRDPIAATAALRHVMTETEKELSAAAEIFVSSSVVKFGSAIRKAFDRFEPLLLSRGAQGQVRHCHGDLHLRNIVLIDGKPVLFDAIEFDETIATCDILYDLSFLLMDLCQHGLHTDANKLMNRYMWSSENEHLQIEGLALLPLFLSLRAAIRAKVTASQLRLDPKSVHLRDEARAYLEAAQHFLDPEQPRLIAIGGLSGSGKTTLAAALAPSFGKAPGALHLRSDIERKRLFNQPQTARLPADAYMPKVSDKIYRTLREHVEAALRANHSVIVDATYHRPIEREAITEVAVHAGIDFLGIWLDAPTEIMQTRVSERRGDASDATAAIVSAQASEDSGAIVWQRHDASAGIEKLKVALALAERPAT